MSAETPDDWRQLSQSLPKSVYDRLFEQLRRVALANGISPDHFTVDSKFAQEVGPRVMVWECLVLLLENTENEKSLRA